VAGRGRRRTRRRGRRAERRRGRRRPGMWVAGRAGRTGGRADRCFSEGKAAYATPTAGWVCMFWTYTEEMSAARGVDRAMVGAPTMRKLDGRGFAK
jgi:hypothetical protein